MDDLIASFSREWDGGNWPSADFHPTLDVSETDESIQIKVDLPGIKPDDVDVEVRNNVLQITGERKEEREEKGKTWHHTERRVGRFARSLALPCEVQEDKIVAECFDGVLKILLPKAEQAKSKKIAVKGA